MTAGGKVKRPYRMDVRARRSQETARRIREAAMDRFLAGSYESVTLAEIAAAAQVTIPTLVAHFGRKEDLFLSACEARAAEVISARDEAPVGDHTGAIRNLLDSYERHGESILRFFVEEDRFPAVRAMTDMGRRYHRSWVERVFEPSLGSLRRARKELLVVNLIVATDLLAWKLMRLDMRLSRRQVEGAMIAAVEALIGGG